MHPYIKAYLKYMHYRATGVLWFDAREQYYNLVDDNLLWMDELLKNNC